MSGSIRRYSAQREYDLAWAAFDSAHEQFLMAEASQGEVEQRAKRSAARFMSDGFGHLSLATQLDQGDN